MPSRSRRATLSPWNRALRRLPAWVLIAAALLWLLVAQYGPGDELDRIDPGEPTRLYFVERVVDGDTLLLRGGARVRLLGVDTPESVTPDRPVEPLGPEAAEFTRRSVQTRKVRLAFDKERRDRFGRLLAYVYRGDVLLNEELIRAGYSRAQLQYPYSSGMKRRFRLAEEDAKRARRGLWSLSPGTLDDQRPE